MAAEEREYYADYDMMIFQVIKRTENKITFGFTSLKYVKGNLWVSFLLEWKMVSKDCGSESVK